MTSALLSRLPSLDSLDHLLVGRCVLLIWRIQHGCGEFQTCLLVVALALVLAGPADADVLPKRGSAPAELSVGERIEIDRKAYRRRASSLPIASLRYISLEFARPRGDTDLSRPSRAAASVATMKDVCHYPILIPAPMIEVRSSKARDAKVDHSIRDGVVEIRFLLVTRTETSRGWSRAILVRELVAKRLTLACAHGAASIQHEILVGAEASHDYASPEFGLLVSMAPQVLSDGRLKIFLRISWRHRQILHGEPVVYAQAKSVVATMSCCEEVTIENPEGLVSVNELVAGQAGPSIGEVFIQIRSQHWIKR